MSPHWLHNKLQGLRAISKFDNRVEVVINRLLYRKSRLAVYRLGSFEILMDHRAGDQASARHVLSSDMYRRFLKKLEHLDRPNVLDLGASNGGFPILLAQAGTQMAKLCCVEMHPRTFTRLNFNISTNLPGLEVTTINAAICSDGRSVRLSLQNEGTGASIYDCSGGLGTAIPGITFDALVDRVFKDECIDVVKMDVEGAEYEILFGEHCRHLERCRYLLIEIHPHEVHKPSAVRKQLERVGFRETDFSQDKEGVALFANRALVVP